MHDSFLLAGRSFRRSRLRGWKEFYKYCVQKRISAGDLFTHPRPDVLYANFVDWLHRTHVKDYIRKDAAPAAQQLFDLARGLGSVNLAQNMLARSLRRNTAVYVKKLSSNRDIWDFALFLQFARECPDPRKWPWKPFRGLAAAIISVFSPCRTIALTTIRRSTAKRSADGKSVTVLCKEKTDHGMGRTELVIRDAPEWRLSAKVFYDVCDARAERLGSDALFCSDTGNPYTTSDTLCKAMTELLTKSMHVVGYTGYSFRAAFITAMIRRGMTETEVNAYTGHSPNAHTALSNYFRLDKQWAGARLHALPTDRIPVPAVAARLMQEDGEDD
jgi:hypothetical protein